jgi:beta-mannosidase
VPRDRGTGWDFEDVRDHYVRELFGVEPMVVRYSDPERYLELGRIVVAELLARTMATWRAGAECGGALIYTLRDLVLGAGWGLVDSAGRPKSPYWSLARVCAPVAVLASDDGLDGLGLHVVNDGATEGRYDLEVELWRAGDQQVATASTAIEVPARGRVSVRADALFEGFRDLTYAYRFGPPGHDAVVARLVDLGAGGATVSETVHFPLGLPAPIEADLGLRATGRVVEGGGAVVTVTTERLARWVTVRAPGYLASDSYFHLLPGRPRDVVLTATGTAEGTPSAEVRAANSATSARATWERERSG